MERLGGREKKQVEGSGPAEVAGVLDDRDPGIAGLADETGGLRVARRVVMDLAAPVGARRAFGTTIPSAGLLEFTQIGLPFSSTSFDSTHVFCGGSRFAAFAEAVAFAASCCCSIARTLL